MLAFNLRSPLFRDGAYQSFDLYIIVKRGHSDVNKKHFRVPLTNILLFQRTFLWSMWESNPLAGEHPSTEPFACSSTTANYSTPKLASIWGNDLPNLL